MLSSRSIVLFVIDGLRPDGLLQADTPNIDSLISNGVYTLEARTVIPSITLPCIASMFLGTSPEQHGITTNTWTPINKPILSIIDLAHSANMKTASFYNWEPLRDLSKPGSLDAALFQKNIDAPQGDQEIAEIAANYLLKKPTTFAFIYLGYTDIAGHNYGWMTDSYVKAIKNADVAIGKVLDALKTSDSIDNTVFIVASDHGGHEKTHGTNMLEDMTIPWIISGLKIQKEHGIKNLVNIMDTAPTIAALLGLDQPESWTGRIIIDAIKSLH